MDSEIELIEYQRKLIDYEHYSTLDEDEVISLLTKYGLPLEVKGPFPRIHIGILSRIAIVAKNDTIMQIAKLALLMKSCMGGKIEIHCTISDPQKGEVKGTSKAIEIENHFFNDHFSRFLHTLICQRTGYFYNGYAVLSNDNKMYDYGNFRFSEDFTEEELMDIIMLEEYDLDRKLTYNAKLGSVLDMIHRDMSKYGLFEGLTQRKIYSFLYDLFVLHGLANDIGEGFSGTIGKEKADWIKNRYNAYFKQSIKFCDEVDKMLQKRESLKKE